MRRRTRWVFWLVVFPPRPPTATPEKRPHIPCSVRPFGVVSCFAVRPPLWTTKRRRLALLFSWPARDEKCNVLSIRGLGPYNRGVGSLGWRAVGGGGCGAGACRRRVRVAGSSSPYGLAPPAPRGAPPSRKAPPPPPPSSRLGRVPSRSSCFGSCVARFFLLSSPQRSATRQLIHR